MAVGGSPTAGEMSCISADPETETIGSCPGVKPQDSSHALPLTRLGLPKVLQSLKPIAPGEDQVLKRENLWDPIYIYNNTVWCLVFNSNTKP